MSTIIKMIYKNAVGYDYNSSRVEYSLKKLRDSKAGSDKNDHLSIVLSKLKYCIDMSVIAYSETITHIILELEDIYDLSDLLDTLLEE